MTFSLNHGFDFRQVAEEGFYSVLVALYYGGVQLRERKKFWRTEEQG